MILLSFQKPIGKMEHRCLPRKCHFWARGPEKEPEMQKTQHPESWPRGPDGTTKTRDNLSARRPGRGSGVQPLCFSGAGEWAAEAWLQGSEGKREPGRCSCCALHTTLCGGEERGSSSRPRSPAPRRAAEDGQDLGIWVAGEDGIWTSNKGEQAEQRDRVRGRA